MERRTGAGRMKKSLISILLLVALSNANAFILNSTSPYRNANDWVTMYNKGHERINYQYMRCFYEGNGFSISINAEYSCPYNIEYNPKTGEWK
jgi:hypothetical protein